MLEILLGNTIAAAALAAAVFIVCRCIRPSPAVQHALWLVVMLKLLSPIGLLWSVSLPIADAYLPLAAESDRLTSPEPHALKEQSTDLALASDQSDSVVASVTVPIEEDDLSPSTDPLPSQSAAPTANRRLLLEAVSWWLLLLWVCGALVVAWRYLRRTIRFARFAQSGRLAAPSLQRQVADVAGQLNVQAPRVRVLGELPSPVVWCVLRRVLLWPKGLQDRLSNAGRRAVLVHELAHLRRRDHWVRWLELAAAVIHWWNPLFWLVRRQMRLHAELACDAWVMGMLPDARRPYAEALLEVCARSTRAAAPSPAVGIGGEGRCDFQRRLTMIMRERVPCRLAAGAKLFVVLLAMAALPAWTLGQGGKNEPAKPAPKNKQPELQLRLLLDNLQFQIQGGSEESKAKEIEARIAELTKQLKSLKERKEAAAPPKKGQELDLEAAIIQLLKQQEKVQKQKEAAEKLKKEAADAPKKAQPLEFKIEGDLPMFPFRMAKDGKPAEKKPDDSKVAPNMLFKLTPNGTGWMIVEDGKPAEKKSADAKPASNLFFKVGPGEPDKSKPAEAPPGKPVWIEIGNIKPQAQIKIIGPDGKEIKGLKFAVGNDEKAPSKEPAEKFAGIISGAGNATLMLCPEGAIVQNPPAKRPKQEGIRMLFFNSKEESKKTDPGAKTIVLSRTTYKLSKQRAETLAAFLKANTKPSVLEFKVDDEGLTVTTTPEVQATVGNIVNLMRSKPEVIQFQLELGNFEFHFQKEKEKKK